MAEPVLTGQPSHAGGPVDHRNCAARTDVRARLSLTCHRVSPLPLASGEALRTVGNGLSFMARAVCIDARQLRRQRFNVAFVDATLPPPQGLAAVAPARLESCPPVGEVRDLRPRRLHDTRYGKHPRTPAAMASVARFNCARHDLVMVQPGALVAPVRALPPDRVPVLVHAKPVASAADATAAHSRPRESGVNLVVARILGTARAFDIALDADQKLRELAGLCLLLDGSGGRSERLAAPVHARGLASVQRPGRFKPAQILASVAEVQDLPVTLMDEPTMAPTAPRKVQTHLAARRPVIAVLRGEGARGLYESAAGLACDAGSGRAQAQQSPGVGGEPVTPGPVCRRWHAQLRRLDHEPEPRGRRFDS